MRFAIIGTRSPWLIDKSAIRMLNRAIDWACQINATIRTGASKGVDQKTAERVSLRKRKIELVLPWRDFEVTWIDRLVSRYPNLIRIEVFDPVQHHPWLESVDVYHPEPTKLQWQERRLHARNYGIVAHTDAVIALPRPPEEGGTGQGMRVARGLGIPLFNLNLVDDQERIQAFALETTNKLNSSSEVSQPAKDI